tara:strand:+ start:1189 stop:1395 length:207 start_codon:yes stop_codon:yes gene_type:complete
MTDKQILDEVYYNLRDMNQAHINTVEGQERLKDKIKATLDFVETEWQKNDEEEQRNEYNRNRPFSEHK